MLLFIFIQIDSLLMVWKQSYETKKTKLKKEPLEAKGVFIVYRMDPLYSYQVFLASCGPAFYICEHNDSPSVF